MAQAQDLRRVYYHIIDDVVAKMKPEFVQESVDESVLHTIRQRWAQKLTERGMITEGDGQDDPSVKREDDGIGQALNNMGVRKRPHDGAGPSTKQEVFNMPTGQPGQPLPNAGLPQQQRMPNIGVPMQQQMRPGIPGMPGVGVQQQMLQQGMQGHHMQGMQPRVQGMPAGVQGMAAGVQGMARMGIPGMQGMHGGQSIPGLPAMAGLQQVQLQPGQQQQLNPQQLQQLQQLNPQQLQQLQQNMHQLQQLRQLQQNMQAAAGQHMAGAPGIPGMMQQQQQQPVQGYNITQPKIPQTDGSSDLPASLTAAAEAAGMSPERLRTLLPPQIVTAMAAAHARGSGSSSSISVRAAEAGSSSSQQAGEAAAAGVGKLACKGLGKQHKQQQRQQQQQRHIPQVDGPGDDDGLDEEDEGDEEEEGDEAGEAGGEAEDAEEEEDIEDDEDIQKLDADLDALEEADQEDIKNVGFALYEKVHRAKNRWRCNLRFGVFFINGKEYMFNKGSTDLTF